MPCLKALCALFSGGEALERSSEAVDITGSCWHLLPSRRCDGAPVVLKGRLGAGRKVRSSGGAREERGVSVVMRSPGGRPPPALPTPLSSVEVSTWSILLRGSLVECGIAVSGGITPLPSSEAAPYFI